MFLRIDREVTVLVIECYRRPPLTGNLRLRLLRTVMPMFDRVACVMQWQLSEIRHDGRFEFARP